MNRQYVCVGFKTSYLSMFIHNIRFPTEQPFNLCSAISILVHTDHDIKGRVSEFLCSFTANIGKQSETCPSNLKLVKEGNFWNFKPSEFGFKTQHFEVQTTGLTWVFPKFTKISRSYERIYLWCYTLPSRWANNMDFTFESLVVLIYHRNPPRSFPVLRSRILPKSNVIIINWLYIL